MRIYDYILIFLIAVAAYFAIRFIISQKKKGKCVGCSSGSCSNCQYSNKNKK